MSNIDAAIEHIAAAAAAVELSIGDYAPIRSAYKIECAGYITEYLYSDSVRITRFRNLFKKAILAAFYPAFEQGLIDGGGAAPAEGEDLEWINARVEREFGFVDELFYQLRDLKKEAKDEGAGILAGVSEARSEGYARTLDGIYSAGKVRGAANKMLTLGGPDGKESCGTCQRLKGQRHKASWWKNHGLLIYRGNDNYECGCWECQHYLYDDKGQVYTF
jgi:hypothetical protein